MSIHSYALRTQNFYFGLFSEKELLEWMKPKEYCVIKAKEKGIPSYSLVVMKEKELIKIPIICETNRYTLSGEDESADEITKLIRLYHGKKLKNGIELKAAARRPHFIITEEQIVRDDDWWMGVREGSFGSIYKATLTTGQGSEKKCFTVAVKRPITKDGMEMLFREARLLNILQTNQANQHIVLFLGITLFAEVSLIFEYADGGALSEYLCAKGGPANFAIATRTDWLLQISKGMRFIVMYDMVHRDLKLDNILIMADKNELKIADFGLAGYTKEGKGTEADDVYQFGDKILGPLFEDCVLESKETIEVSLSSSGSGSGGKGSTSKSSEKTTASTLSSSSRTSTATSTESADEDKIVRALPGLFSSCQTGQQITFAELEKRLEKLLKHK